MGKGFLTGKMADFFHSQLVPHKSKRFFENEESELTKRQDSRSKSR